jgi:choline dehydrogenase
MQEASGGAAITNVRIRDGRRLNIPSSYLYPVMDQANLTVLTGAHVNRLTIEGNTVTGVEFEWQNEVRRIKASSEVVLSAGAIQTPKTLMLSGIGDRAELHCAVGPEHVPAKCCAVRRQEHAPHKDF